MKDLEMIRDLNSDLPELILPEGFKIISVHEDNGYIWDELMDAAFGNHPSGSFRYVMVSNNGYEENRVFVLLDDKHMPIATSSAWHYGMENWNCSSMPEVSFVAVPKEFSRNGYGKLMVTNSLHQLKQRGYSVAHLGVRGTGTGGNYPALKTYINCGFVPYIVEEEQIEAWKEVYKHFGLIPPELKYLPPIYSLEGLPHPPRPWPYQMRRVLEANKNGECYIFGEWNACNMYIVDKDQFIHLKPLIYQSGRANEIISEILAEQVECIYINHPYNPKSFLITFKNGGFLEYNINADPLFFQGVKTFLANLSNEK